MRIEVVNLRAEAAAEVHRLATARALAVAGDERALAGVEGDGPWIAVARGNSIRRALGRRLLLVWRTAFEDAGGAIVESRLVPVAVDVSRVPRGRQRRGWIEAVLSELEPQVRARIDAATGDWRQSVGSVVGGFTSTRIARERAIAAAAASSAAQGVFQPGLFDRRAERARTQNAVAAADAQSAAAVRVEAFARSNALSPRPADLLLVFVP